MIKNLVIILYVISVPLCAMENQDTGLDHFLNQEAKNFLKMCNGLRYFPEDVKPFIRMDGINKLIENRLNNNISLDLAVRIPYEGGPKVPLYITSHQEQLISLTKKLLKLGANPNGVTSKSTLSPLNAAANASAVKTVKVLLKAGADPNAEGLLIDAVKSAAEKSLTQYGPIKIDIKNISLLLKHGANPNVTWKAVIVPLTDAYVSPLLYVMEYMDRGALSVMRKLLKAGADPNYTIKDTKESLLHMATFFTIRASSIEKGKKYAKTAKLLLHYGANPNAQDKLGRTPLFNIKFAINTTNLEIFKLLLLFGTDMNIKRLPEPDYGKRPQNALEYASTPQTLDDSIGARFLKDWQEGKIKLKMKKLR